MTARSDVVSRLDPALRRLGAARIDLTMAAIEPTRSSLNQRRGDDAKRVDATGVTFVDDMVAADHPRRSIPVRIYRGSAEALAPAVIYCHAGAFVLGNLDIDHRQCIELARRARCTVISVDYRLAPEHPYPAALDDAATTLRWVVAQSTAVSVDASRIAVAGNSAGGALAAGLAQCAAQGSVPPIVFQSLHQPVIDDRPTESKAEFTTTSAFDGPASKLMWQYYGAGQMLPDEAVPGRQRDLAGMVAALVTCSELDPLRDEAIDYARRLMWAGVATELHVFPRTCHGFDSMMPDWETSRELFAIQGAALRRALHPPSTSDHPPEMRDA